MRRRDQATTWLEKTIFWQRLMLLFLACVWMGAIGMTVQHLYTIEAEPVEKVLQYILVRTTGLGIVAYLLQQLHQSIEQTKVYKENNRAAVWQEVLRYQGQFWKVLCLALLLAAALWAWIWCEESTRIIKLL